MYIQRPVYSHHMLSQGPYFVGDGPESWLGVVLLASARGYPVGWWDDDQWIKDGKLPILCNLLRNLSFDDLKIEAQSAAGILTSDCCGPDHIFGYDCEWDAWGVWPTTPSA